MYFLETPWIALRSFFELGGPVLFFILIATTIMWTFIIERFWFFTRVMPRLKKAVVDEWQSRRDTTSWQAARIRDLLLSELAVQARQFLFRMGGPGGSAGIRPGAGRDAAPRRRVSACPMA